MKTAQSAKIIMGGGGYCQPRISHFDENAGK